MQWMHKHSWTPFPHLIKGAGVGPSKNWVTWGVQNFLLERGDKPKKRKWRGCHFLITNSSIIFTVCGENICTFLIHSGSLQKMLTALSNLVWNTQKSKWANFFLSAKAKCFLVSKRFYKRWVRSETFICPYIVLNVNVSFNFCARLGSSVIWFVKSMKMRKLKIEIISL